MTTKRALIFFSILLLALPFLMAHADLLLPSKGTEPELPPLTPQPAQSWEKKAPKSLQERSTELAKAATDLASPDSVKIFFRLFPKSKSDFSKLCLDIKVQASLPTGDCHDIIVKGLGDLSSRSETADAVGEMMLDLASKIKFDADAPSYLQMVLNRYCSDQTKSYLASLNSMAVKDRDKALRFQNEQLHDSNAEGFAKCVEALKASDDKIGKVAATFLKKKSAK